MLLTCIIMSITIIVSNIVKAELCVFAVNTLHFVCLVCFWNACFQQLLHIAPAWWGND